ncbi:hypothetical protein LXL04_021429 [Taraxacum kok-saghyz]
MAEKQKMSMLKSLRRTPDSACVIVPTKVFRILERPVHEFHGHNGEVLDLSWSNDGVLIADRISEFSFKRSRTTKIYIDTALKTFAQTEESKSSDPLLTPTALANHPDIPQSSFPSTSPDVLYFLPLSILV